jgi:uncharacterized protein
VLEVDVPRQRIALTMRLTDEPTKKSPDNDRAPRNQTRPQPRPPADTGNNAMAAAFAKLREKV